MPVILSLCTFHLALSVSVLMKNSVLCKLTTQKLRSPVILCAGAPCLEHPSSLHLTKQFPITVQNFTSAFSELLRSPGRLSSWTADVCIANRLVKGKEREREWWEERWSVREGRERERWDWVSEREREREGGDVAQLVEHRTGSLPTQVRFPGAARDFSPRVSFQCRPSRSTVSVHPPCTIAPIYICAQR